VLPGIQALFGFQLIAVFNDKFAELQRSEQVTHLVSLLLVALAVAIIMTPAAYHRQAEQGRISDRFIRLASRLMTVAMVPLMLGLCLDIYLVSEVILRSPVTSVAIVSLLFCVFLTLWFIYPQAKRRRPPA
jgi:cytochrome bd-type quinol oxidase subunit 2